MTSSVAERLEENGRTYHSYKGGKYMLPNDETELNRLGRCFVYPDRIGQRSSPTATQTSSIRCGRSVSTTDCTWPQSDQRRIVCSTSRLVLVCGVSILVILIE